MQPAQTDRLSWLQPIGMPADQFAALRPDLNRLLATPQDNEVYSVNTRSIYQVDDPALGPIAIKELRFVGGYQAFRAAYLRRHRVLCEFRAGSCFASRGGRTPAFLGAALERNALGFSRIFLILHWLHDARTLTEVVKAWGEPVPAVPLQALARALVGSARCGLVHGRHSSENILVGQDGKFYTIDFSHAQIMNGFSGSGFAFDAARIGARLIMSHACSREAVMVLFDEIVRVGAPDVTAAGRMQMEAECDHILAISKRRQRLERRFRTVLRGLPMRLNG
jgi:hypothetical protein